MEVEFGGDYLNIESSKDGEIAEITGEGEYVEIDFQGIKKKVFNIPINVSGTKKIYTPGNKAGKILIKSFGKDTKNWIGKKFEVVHIENKMLIRPLTEIKV